ncbi:MAG TPA: TonB-dependent receptor [Steroidobacter sp.]|uniref:TonB-dependent receptor n=1 Tax=Steroidobacter sp. TaxID=1978227 RepID=UPI002ED8611F
MIRARTFPATAVLLGMTGVVLADEPAQPQSMEPGAVLQTVVVTARRREENLQRVPDPVTAITADRIEAAGITQVEHFMSKVPNLTFRDGTGYRSGYAFISMRGIGNGQEGWAPVTFMIDGVPSSSLDSIKSGSLDDIERIEVLRGPQSALYGAGAIAGAINVVTRKPDDEFRARLRAAYANGNDRSVAGMVSGPLREELLRFQLQASYRDSDGLISSQSNGLDLDFEKKRKVAARFIYTPSANVELDLRGEYVREENGSTYQDKLTSPDLIDDFGRDTRPRRRFPGEDDRELGNVSLRATFDFGNASLISVSGYSDIQQEIESSLCYDDPDDPAIDDPSLPGLQASCLLGPAFGSSAGPGQPIDDLFSGVDDLQTFTQDLRIVSNGDGRIRWLAGASYLHRKSLNGFDASWILPPDNSLLTLFPLWNGKKDEWWGVYSQISGDLTDRMELTVAARYDENDYTNTTYTDRHKTTIVQVPDENGVLVNSQQESANKVQPKVQLSYRWTPDLMTYATWSKGFRAGFFASGGFTRPESTRNIEIGLKSTLFGDRMVANLSAFHIDYSDQQFSTVIPQPPYRQPVTLPETDIDGVEFETSIVLSSAVSLDAGFGYLDSRDVEGFRSPFAPKFTGNISLNTRHPLAGEWFAIGHVDYRHNSSMYLGRNETSRIPSKDFVDARLGVESDNWRVVAFSRNLFSTRQSEVEVPQLAGGYPRISNKPRSYGIEFTYSY